MDKDDSNGIAAVNFLLHYRYKDKRKRSFSDLYKDDNLKDSLLKELKQVLGTTLLDDVIVLPSEYLKDRFPHNDPLP